ncbi:hypothetical protein LCGC14_1860030 [marine sediment metagenome]|uniref:Uncharacterized protein n=1 Tax=marine sediment metagenome TaxID=412755 RepID=A0A0F9GW86_9ZZZZ
MNELIWLVNDTQSLVNILGNLLIIIGCAFALATLWDWVRKRRKLPVFKDNLKMQFLGVSGSPLSGGNVHTYSAGTTMPLASYTDPSCSVVNPNPVILDSDGKAPIWFDSPGKVIVIMKRFDLKTRKIMDNVVWTVDNLSGGNRNDVND